MATQIAHNIVYGHAESQPLLLDLYTPDGPAASRPLALLIHGGGWRSGDKADPQVVMLAQQLASWGLICASINYRLAPDHPAPAAAEDCQAAAAWLRAYGCERGAADGLLAIGSSAGGHLALLLALSPLPPARQANAAVSFAGITDVHDLLAGPNLRDFATDWVPPTLPDQDSLAARLSPLTYAAAGDAPLLLAHGDADETVPFAQAERLHRARRDAGKPATFAPIGGAGHGLATLLGPTFGPQTRAAVAAFLEAHGYLREPVED